MGMLTSDDITELRATYEAEATDAERTNRPKLRSMADIARERKAELAADVERWGAEEARRVNGIRLFFHWVDNAAETVESDARLIAFEKVNPSDYGDDADEALAQAQRDALVHVRRGAYKLAMGYADALVGWGAVTSTVPGGYDVLLTFVTSRGLR